MAQCLEQNTAKIYEVTEVLCVDCLLHDGPLLFSDAAVGEPRSAWLHCPCHHQRLKDRIADVPSHCPRCLA